MASARPLTLLESLPPGLLHALDLMRQAMDALDSVVVAYSGGVDSSLVAAIAAERLGDRAIAVTGVSPALAPHLLEEARSQAHWLGLKHREIPTAELDISSYTSNPPDRCYACKRELHGLLAQIRIDVGASQVLDGVNLDDLQDHRPGLRAARERDVRSPLAEAGIDKSGVRQLSRALGLPWWDKPAQPCLASRFPYGEPITATRLRRVGAAEAWLREKGFGDVRVRSQGETARIELPSNVLPGVCLSLATGSLRQEMVDAFRALGFHTLALDLEGLVSGKLNRDLAGPATDHDRG
ncbi:MAG: ATP-dependent sacrificial sulfur transferase LarE [Cyanobium sp.]